MPLGNDFGLCILRSTLVAENTSVLYGSPSGTFNAQTNTLSIFNPLPSKVIVTPHYPARRSLHKRPFVKRPGSWFAEIEVVDPGTDHIRQPPPCSASTPIICRMARPVGVAVSIASVSEWNFTPRARRSSSMVIRSRRLRPSRSGPHTINVSTSSSFFRQRSRAGRLVVSPDSRHL
jgi:hypothetical protein